MPTYSYACTECDDRFDAVQAFSDDALTTCTKCEGRLRKLFNSVGVVFKGSGFYRNDSREAAKSAVGISSSSSTSDSSSSDSKPSDSKPSESKSSDANSSGSSDAKSAKSSDSKPAAKTAAKAASN